MSEFANSEVIYHAAHSFDNGSTKQVEVKKADYKKFEWASDSEESKSNHNI